eukprot:4092204-Lingulodinium_polyedra.AAC.1
MCACGDGNLDGCEKRARSANWARVLCSVRARVLQELRLLNPPNLSGLDPVPIVTTSVLMPCA